MKIAREIAEAVNEEHWYSDDGTGRAGIDITSSELESIVAAKLEPVRDALSLAYEHAAPDDQAMPYLQPVRDALAMFDD